MSDSICPVCGDTYSLDEGCEPSVCHPCAQNAVGILCRLVDSLNDMNATQFEAWSHERGPSPDGYADALKFRYPKFEETNES